MINASFHAVKSRGRAAETEKENSNKQSLSKYLDLTYLLIKEERQQITEEKKKSSSYFDRFWFYLPTESKVDLIM